MSLGGFHGKYLLLDLTTGKSETKPLSDEIIKDFIGARGIGTKLLYEYQKGGIDPLGEDSHLIIFTGPFSGTNTPGSSRLAFVSKSPPGKTVNASGMGGKYPIGFKKTGFDGLVIKGISKEKVWLHLTPEGITIHPADDIWGMKSSEAEEKVKEQIDEKSMVCSIGPAGEKLVAFAAIVSETRTAARGGCGAVMGSKNIKAIAVSGNVKTPVADSEALSEVIKLIREDQKDNPALMGVKMNGTAGMISICNTMGMLPTKNFQTGVFEGEEKITGSTIGEKNKIKSVACASCSVACSIIAEVKSGKYKGIRSEGPEYESAAMLGSNLMIDDLDTIIASNYLCDEWGIDTISTGNVIGFAMECFEKGLITTEDTGGIELTWGNCDAVLELINLIGNNEGFGARLAKGVKSFSDEIPGSSDFAIQVKGIELSAYDPRGINSQGLSYTIAPRGGDHGKGGYMITEFFEMGDIDYYGYEGKAEKVIALAELAAIYDLVAICTFNFTKEPFFCKLINAVMGLKHTEESLRANTRKTINLERKFNIREGFTRKDDTLPMRLLNEPLPEGAAEGKTVQGLDIMIDEFYQLMGWDKEGNPPE